MNMHDLVIRGGTLVDGSGAEPRPADVALAGDRITAVGRDLGAARETIDARDKLVLPGSSTSTPTTTARRPGTRCSRRRAGTASRRS